MLRRSVLGDPVSPASRGVKASHVRYGRAGDHGLPEVRTLHRRRVDRETAVAPTEATRSRGMYVSLRGQPFSGRDEVVEDVLLMLSLACPIPILAELSAASRADD